MTGATIEELVPFGLLIRAEIDGSDISTQDVSEIKEKLAQNRVVLFRGFRPLTDKTFIEFCRRFGEMAEFDFGVVNELKVVSDAKNYLYTNSEVPFHWDGAFIGRVPGYICFHCDEAPEGGTGGETLFADTTRILAAASPAERETWKQIEISYSTEKVVHYGGSFASPVVCHSPIGEFDVIRFAEPVTDLNPVQLEITGIDDDAKHSFLCDMKARLNDPSICFVHEWKAGDLLIADNHTLLHGRRAFKANAKRLIRRINIL